MENPNFMKAVPVSYCLSETNAYKAEVYCITKKVEKVDTRAKEHKWTVNDKKDEEER
jgi:hypothetical protein